MDEERDYVVFTDEEGNEFELDVIKYFFYKGDEYAILADCACECECGDEECEDEEEGGLYIMKIIVSEDGATEEFVPPEDEDMDELIEIAENELCEDDCCCGDDCDCDCEHDHCDHDHCDCGCEDK